VHTTQFRIHEPSVGLLEPVLALAAEEMDRADAHRHKPLVRVAGICGDTMQAVREAELAKKLGYQFGLVSMGAMRGRTLEELVDHCRAVSEVIDVFGFYLQPKVGGVDLPLEFWRRFCRIERVAAIKVAAFDRYKTLDVVRAVAESGRRDIALYTGNDDNIVVDLLTNYQLQIAGRTVEQRFRGGLLGQWAVWTSNAVDLLHRCRRQFDDGAESPSTPQHWLELAMEITDANAAIFDAAHDFRGCLPGIYEILRRQGLLANNYCLDEHETLSSGQAEEIDRVTAAYPHLQDDLWVSEHLDRWLQD
jgi:dihydrodipicolinate synthase/N-acetylneuraminate lyase